MSGKVEDEGPDPVDVHVGLAVKAYRLRAGMNQQSLGKAVKVTFQQIQKYEKGTNRIGASRLQHISTVLGVSVSFFFDGLPAVTAGAAGAAGFAEDASPAYVSDFLATSEGIALTRAFLKIPDSKVRRRIVDLVEALAGTEAQT